MSAIGLNAAKIKFGALPSGSTIRGWRDQVALHGVLKGVGRPTFLADEEEAHVFTTFRPLRLEGAIVEKEVLVVTAHST